MNIENGIMNLIRESKTNPAVKTLLHWYAQGLNQNDSYVFQEQLKHVLITEKDFDNYSNVQESYIPL